MARRRPIPRDERQTILLEFFVRVTVHFIPLRSSSRQRRGLAEKLLRQRLENRGWTVWRGDLVGILRERNLYPNVARKYRLLCDLLEQYRPGTLELLQYLCAVHHGLPDLLCFRRGRFKWVECKLGHEQLRDSQKRCIPLLLRLGFPVEIHKLVEHCTLARKAILDLRTGEKKVIEKQLRLTKRLCAKSS